MKPASADEINGLLDATGYAAVVAEESH